MAWGVDIEPVLAMVSLAFGKNYNFNLFVELRYFLYHVV